MNPLMINALKVVGQVAIGAVSGLLIGVGMETVEMKYMKYKNRKKEVES